MSKQYPIQISIPAPCNQDWAKMQPNEQGRFCNQCSKTVIDFTTWSDTALFEFFSKDHGHVCGRFLSTQLDRPISIPFQPHSRLYRLTVALGLTLLFAQATTVTAQQKAPLITTLQPLVPDTTATGEIKGVILDEKREPVIQAVIQVYRDHELLSTVFTDYDGLFIVKPLPSGTFRVEMTYRGYDTLVTTDVIVNNAQATRLNARLTRVAATAKPGITVVAFKKPLTGPNMPDGDREHKVLPNTNTVDITTITPSPYQRMGAPMDNIIRGTRTSGTLYVIDGVQVPSGKHTKHKKHWWHRKRR